MGRPRGSSRGVIYGIVIVGSVIAVESAAHPSAAGETFATVLVLIIYWMAHAYSEMMGERFRTSRPLDWGHAMLSLSCVALLGGMRAHLRPWPLAAQALVGIVFGVAIGGVRAMLG